jgi:hypothetical protein
LFFHFFRNFFLVYTQSNYSVSFTFFLFKILSFIVNCFRLLSDHELTTYNQFDMAIGSHWSYIFDYDYILTTYC